MKTPEATAKEAFGGVGVRAARWAPKDRRSRARGFASGTSGSFGLTPEAPLFFLEDLGAALLGDLGRSLATGERGLLDVVLVDRTERIAKLEERQLAAASLADAEGHHGSTNAGAHVESSLGPGLVGTARAVEAMDVFVSAELADSELVQPSERDLPGMGVAGENEWDAVMPQPIRFFRDVAQADRRKIVSHPTNGGLAVGMTRVGVVQADDLEALMPQGDDRVLIAQNLDTCAMERTADAIGPRPVVVVSEHADHRRFDLTQNVLELIEIHLTVANEVAGDDHQIGRLRVREAHCLALHTFGSHSPEVHVGQVSNPEVLELLGVPSGARKPAKLDRLAPEAIEERTMASAQNRRTFVRIVSRFVDRGGRFGHW